MIIECNGNTTEEKLKSLQESVQLALNNVEASGLQEGAKIGTIIIQKDGTMGGLIDGKYVVLKNLSADNIVAGDVSADRLQAAFADIIDLEVKSINGYKIVQGSVVAAALADAVVSLFTDTTVYYRSEAPTGTTDKPLKNGDMWYKTVGQTNELDKVYLYTDGSWVEKTLDASMFTAGTITAREIASGTITAAQIAANTITAAQIAANTITADKITTSDIAGTNGKINLASGTFEYGGGSTGNGISWDGNDLNIRGTLSVSSTIGSGGRTLQELNSIVDNTIETWYENGVPGPSVPPESNWLSPDVRSQHKGDLYYNTATGKAYRYTYSNSTYTWQVLADNDIAKALQIAGEKKRIINSTTLPTPAYDVGDLWVNPNGETKVCIVAKAEGVIPSASDWEVSNNYSSLIDAVAGELSDEVTRATNAEATIDGKADQAIAAAEVAVQSANGKNTIYHQPTQPSGGTYKTGDTWFDTDDDNKIYKYNGSAWVAVVLGDDAIGELNASHITAGTIDASQITVSNIDAGNISSGYIDAARIRAGSITIGALGTDVTTTINSKASQSSLDATNTNLANNYPRTTSMNSAIDAAKNSAISTAESYANTAGNRYQQCIVLDGAGVKVRNASYPNNAVRMASDGIEFYKGGQSVAYYTDTSIQLGKNSSSSVIQMCGDQARLSYADGSVYLGATTGDMTIQVGTQQGLTIKGTSDSGGVIILQSLYASGRTPARRVYMPTIYQGRNTGAAPVGVNANGWLATTGDSTRKIKHDIRSLDNEELDPHNLYNLPVIQFKYNSDYLSDEDERYDTDLIGFIAEDVENVYPIACDHDNGEVRNWNHRYIIPPMLKLIQEQHEEIETLKARVTALERGQTNDIQKLKNL